MTFRSFHPWQRPLAILAVCLLPMMTGCQLLDCSSPVVQAPASMERESVRELLGGSRSKDMYVPSLPTPVLSETEVENVDYNQPVYSADPQAGKLLYDTDYVAANDREESWDALEPPRELSMVALPAYRIAPPDYILIEAIKLAPRSPNLVQHYDKVAIRVRGTMKDLPIEGIFLVDSEGKVTLGPIYGSVHIAGLTYEEAGEKIRKSLKKVLPNPEVAVLKAPTENDPKIGDIYQVESDGTVILNRYGVVHLAGKTVEEARQAIEDHLSWYFDSPRVGVKVYRSNSKFFYVILGGNLADNNIIRVPIMGNETVLDAIGQIHGLTPVSSKTMWIARPAPTGFGQDQILSVDWNAIARGGITDTNYQLMPRDRLYIVDDKVYVVNSFISKLTSPIERLLNISTQGTQLGSLTETQGREYNRTRRQ
jgi:polysaccharide biosynthesis/export protein